MEKLRSAWSAFESNPQVMKRIQGWMTIFWIVMIPVSAVTGLVKSVSYISYLSLIALVLSQGAWWAAASVEAQKTWRAKSLRKCREDRRRAKRFKVTHHHPGGGASACLRW